MARNELNLRLFCPYCKIATNLSQKWRLNRDQNAPLLENRYEQGKTASLALFLLFKKKTSSDCASNTEKNREATIARAPRLVVHFNNDSDVCPKSKRDGSKISDAQSRSILPDLAGATTAEGTPNLHYCEPESVQKPDEGLDSTGDQWRS